MMRVKTLLACGAAAYAFAAAFGRPAPAPPPLLGAQAWTAPVAEGTGAAEIEADHDRREAVVIAAPGRWGFQARLPPRASLRFAVSIDPPDATLRLQAAAGGRILHDERWAGARGWAERRVELPGRHGAAVAVELVIEGGPARVAVAHPEIVGEAAPERPNVIVYVVDCLRADHVGAYGYARSTTPRIDRLAGDGVVFEHVQACASWTKPSVGCLFTSLYPARHGARTVDDALSAAPSTMAEAFRNAGYRTAAWIANPFVSDPAFRLTRGFQQVVQVLDKPPLVNINDLPADAADITRRVVPWLAAHRDRRFFLYLHSIDLHAVYRRRPPFDRMFLSPHRRGEARELDLYDNELAYNDHEIGRLADALKRLRLYDRTLIAVTADHGEEFGEHGFSRHGHTLFQAPLHVPLVLKLPGSARRGARVGALATNLDVAPTLLELAGLEPPAGFQGVSLAPAIAGRPLPDRTLLAEQRSPKEVLFAARDRRYKLIHQVLPEPRQLLFDLAADPGETRDILAEAPQAARGLAAELMRYVQLGQAGYHVAITSPDPEAPYHLEATTAAVFADVQRFSLSAGETLTLSPDRRRLDYRFTAGAATRLLVLRTEPAAADVRLAIAVRGRRLAPAEVRLARDGRHPATVPFVAAAAPLEVPVADASSLVQSGPGVHVWYLAPPAEAPKAAIDPELAQKLRALGYIQ